MLFLLKQRHFMYSLFICFLFFCGQAVYSDNNDTQLSVKDKTKVQTNLVDIAYSVDRSLKELHAIEKASHPIEYKKILAEEKKEAKLYAEKVSIDWTGPVEPLLESIATKYHYQFNILGHAPPIPVLIQLSVKNMALGEVLKNIDWQAGTKAHLSISSSSTGQLIELRYV